VNICYLDIDSRKVSEDIRLLFPEWEKEKERVCVFSPHDDDGIIGAGYAITAAIENGAEVFIVIFCRGNAGYSVPEQKQQIESIRERETIQAYSKIGVKQENILRLNYSDFSALQSMGWYLNNGMEGSFKRTVTLLRKLQITRLLVPNHYREHIDHTAASYIGSFDAPQAGDPILVDWAAPQKIKSILEYSVWADLSPEDMLVNDRKSGLRANRLILIPEADEKRICECISQYKSQGRIINDMIASREERSVESGKYMEVYLSFDPRPKLDFEPYKKFVNEIGGPISYEE
jgi:LmbE family N-acetylglucosaminyl deacetylase